ncbi:ABC transporter ATP-binding protein [Synechococcus sp. RSCCF101]|uniref:ABC transporter ATP-binding protein n=1 Tax=Synechococcus sp. RSCCF101 TaxID=2511069 RepID=UPI001245E700|nr:ABC transporter ATP-binding protein [Synechococcus sp. RSCCF101]QEY33067.1 ABC transporter ATP-binding protein [Synechococcus sp. RSCCF101]
MAEVRFEQVSKSFPGRGGGEPVQVLDRVDLTVPDGEFLVLVGPSGCGKSTLLRLLAGLDEPTGGEILLDGQPISRRPPARRDVAMVFQSYALYPHLSVEDNIGFGLRRRQKRGPREVLVDQLHRWSRRWPRAMRVRSLREERVERRVAEVAELLELDAVRQRRPKELSGGQKQRVALGRAIAREPSVFLMDEPLSNLDAKLRSGTRAQIVGLQRSLGTTTIYVTHDQVEAMTMGHRIAVLNQGRLQQLGTPMELYRWPSNLFVAQFIGSPPMNLLPVQVAAGGTLLLGERRFPIDGVLEAAVEGRVGACLTAGLRPEDLSVAPATNRNLPADVVHCEALGNEQIVSARLLDGDHLVHVRAPASPELAIGQRLHLEVNAAGWRLFEADGEAIAIPRPQAASSEPVLPSFTT